MKTDMGLNGFGNFMMTAQATCTKVETLLPSIYGNHGRVNVWYPSAVGVTLRMADVMTELR